MSFGGLMKITIYFFGFFRVINRGFSSIFWSGINLDGKERISERIFATRLTVPKRRIWEIDYWFFAVISCMFSMILRIWNIKIIFDFSTIWRPEKAGSECESRFIAFSLAFQNSLFALVLLVVHRGRMSNPPRCPRPSIMDRFVSEKRFLISKLVDIHASLNLTFH